MLLTAEITASMKAASCTDLQNGHYAWILTGLNCQGDCPDNLFNGVDGSQAIGLDFLSTGGQWQVRLRARNLCTNLWSDTGYVTLRDGYAIALCVQLPVDGNGRASYPTEVRASAYYQDNSLAWEWQGWLYPTGNYDVAPDLDTSNQAGTCCPGSVRCSDGYCRLCCNKAPNCCSGYYACQDGNCRDCIPVGDSTDYCDAPAQCCSGQPCAGKCSLCTPEGYNPGPDGCNLQCCGGLIACNGTCQKCFSDGQNAGANGCCCSGLTKCSDNVCRSCTPDGQSCAAPCCNHSCSDGVCRSCIPTGRSTSLCSGAPCCSGQSCNGQCVNCIPENANCPGQCCYPFTRCPDGYCRLCCPGEPQQLHEVCLDSNFQETGCSP